MANVKVAQPQAANVTTQVNKTSGGSVKFSALARRNRAQQWSYTVVSPNQNNTISLPFVSIEGYGDVLEITFNYTTSGNVAAVTTVADAPWNLIQNFTFSPPGSFETILSDGYGLYLLNFFGGCIGIGGMGDPTLDPDYSLTTGAVGTGGSFNFTIRVPFEYAKGAGLISWSNDSTMPGYKLDLAPVNSLFGVAPTSVGTLTVQCQLAYSGLPVDPNIKPLEFGSTLQYRKLQGNPFIPSNSNVTVAVAGQGGLAKAIIFVLRDSTGARVESYPAVGTGIPNFIQIQFQQNNLFVTDMNTLTRDMAKAYFQPNRAFSRPTGVLVLPRNESYTNTSLGLLDDLSDSLYNTPGTSITVQGQPWGSSGTAPYQLECYMPCVVGAQK